MYRGIFGGSFDPVHVGHLTVAASAARALNLGLVHLVPACVQPFKTGREPAAAEHRLAMLRLAVAGRAPLVADDREIRRGGVSYTVDTLREISAEHPADRLCLMVGADTARDLPQWRQAEEIARLARIVVLTRPGVAAPSRPPVADVLEVPAVAVSASEVRARVTRGESIRGLVPDAVADYIAEHGLYRTED
jgi:nicotinate-nucleotide adenylyltransferase